MKMDWQSFKGKTLNITMNENYGLTVDPKSDTTIYEIVFKTGRLNAVYDEGILLETQRDEEHVRIFVPFTSIKCVEIFNF